MIRLTNSEYNMISNLVHSKFGINLGGKKQALVKGRLNKVVKQNGFSSFKEYYKYILQDQSGEGLNTLINRISTNHTYFFREKIHLDYFKKSVLPELKTKNAESKQIRIWSCGCSSGQETYVLAMLMREYFGLDINSWKPDDLGVDISPSILEKAKSGIYTYDNV